MKSPKKSNGGEITALKQGVHDPERVNVFLDGKFAFSVSAEQVITRQLRVGQQLTDDQVAALTDISDEEKLFAKLVNFLSFRPRSRKEVEDRLYKYIGEDSVELKTKLLARLTKLGYLNDKEFARWFVQSRQTHRPRSYRHLASELYAKGIDKTIIAETLSEGSDEREAIRQLIIKKQGMERDKLIAYLARRGFSWNLIKTELKSAQS